MQFFAQIKNFFFVIYIAFFSDFGFFCLDQENKKKMVKCFLLVIGGGGGGGDGFVQFFFLGQTNEQMNNKQ